MTLRATGSRQTGDTKGRILDAAEDLFIEHGFEAMSLRQITSHADVNLAAVNYHFGSKEALIHSMLARRLDRLNVERLNLLDKFERRFAETARVTQTAQAAQGAAAGEPGAGNGGLTCEHVLGALFIPALRLSRDRSTAAARSCGCSGAPIPTPRRSCANFLRSTTPRFPTGSSRRSRARCPICRARS